MHRGMTYARLEELGGIQWPCPSEDSLEPPYLHGRLWAEDPAERGRLAPFAWWSTSCRWKAVSDEFPLRLTTGRRLDSYNTGVQSRRLRLAAAAGRDASTCARRTPRALGVADGEMVRVSSRRGTVEAPVRIDPGLRPGLVFMTFHFPDEVDVNLLTIEANDPRSGTAEFKATAVRIEPVRQAVPAPA